MSQKVMLELPEGLAKRVFEIASQTKRPIGEVLVEGIHRFVTEPQVELLPDDQITLLCDAQMDAREQEQLSELLTSNRERTLSQAETARLDELMQAYRRGLVSKARALRVAVARGLRPRLN